MRTDQVATWAIVLWVSATALVAASEPPAGIAADEWRTLQADVDEVSRRIEDARETAGTPAGLERWADADVFRKGLEWAVRYETKLDAKDVALLKKAIVRANTRAAALAPSSPPPALKPGRSVRGYVSRIDDSTQPYGLIVPRSYSADRPMRLDVVLHGSTRPVGLSELRFMDRFDAGDAADPQEKIPDVDYLELHPLGRVENGYRWAGETDVYEAIEAVCRRYRVDRDRIVLRGMSMGASGTWHLGLKRPDQFVALGPYCGYVDTHRFSETPLPNFVKVGRLPDVQEKTLRILDSVEYAANAGVVPAVACMGEKDVFFDAHVIMGEAMKREGLEMLNLISPGTGHVIDPQTHAEQMRRIGEHVRVGLNRAPRQIRFVTWSLKYADCHWVRLLGLQRHYERAELNVTVADDGQVRATEPKNITRFTLHPPLATGSTPRLRIGDQDVALPGVKVGETIDVERHGGRWRMREKAAQEPLLAKRPGLQGPIDDAFTAPFLCVRGTGEPWNPTVAAWSNSALDRFAYEWRRYFRGELPIKDDVDVTPQDRVMKNLILFGDPGSNRWIHEALPNLPIQWTRERLSVAGRDYSAAVHAPTLITANPLPGAGERYLVVNSGHTFHESELASLNYLLYPRSGDWGVWRVGAPCTGAASPSAAVVEESLAFGLADEAWRIAEEK